MLNDFKFEILKSPSTTWFEINPWSSKGKPILQQMQNWKRKQRKQNLKRIET